MNFKITNHISKNDIITMIVIVALSVLLGIFYNFIRSDKIPFFRTPIAERLASDDDLFGTIDEAQNEIQKDNDILEMEVNTTPIDTIEAATINDTDGEIANAEILNYEALLKEAKKSATDNFGVITLSQMQRIAADTTGNFIIVDARRPEDYKEEHIGNAINIFPYATDESSLVEQVISLPKSQTIIVYCDGGDCDSSHKIGEILQIFDYRFFIFEGGWEEWIK